MTGVIARPALALLALLFASSSAAAHDDGAPGFLHLSASYTVLKSSEAVTVHIGLFERAENIAGKAEPASDEDLWFQGIFAERGWYAPRRFRWTDGKRCPQAVTTLRQVRAIAMPRPVLPIPDPEGLEREGDIYVDGRIYQLRVNAADLQGQAIGGLSMSSNINTDLARWSEAMLAALKPCWSNTVPKGVDDFRGTDDDAIVNPVARGPGR